ncbi:outer membrane protein [Labrys okinawensis]|nr:outer membrane protein [Labrys okinawensis]
MRKLLLASSALVCLSGVAMAADLAPTAVEPVAPVAAPFSWTGFYAGLNAGYGWTQSDEGWRHTSGGDAPDAIALRQSLTNHSYDLNGFLGGAQIGYNWQQGHFVVGAEADADFYQKSFSKTRSLLPNFPGNSVTQTGKVTGFYTARVRLGYAFDRTLIYATGGWAGTQLDFRDSSAYPASFQGVSKSEFKSGWTVGAGVEQAVNEHWSVKLEYLYADFGSTKSSSCNNAAPDLCYSHKHDVKTNVVRLGVNYKF